MTSFDTKPKLIGETFHKLMPDNSKKIYGLFECQYCYSLFECMVYDVKRGSTSSCGCKIVKHGLCSHRFYGTWNGMVQRCTNPKIKAYKNYGGRGITVCEDWLDIKIFIEWAEATHPNIQGLSLDRIDNDKGYSPENCRWADRATQRANQRISKDNTYGYKGISFRGISWIAEIGIGNKSKYIGSFKTIEEAIQARDIFIIQNKLPHKLSTEYVKEIK